jgi:UDP-N-acetylmuramyl pentapeptide phosphotransferase/UDP-N-acetylglucosamine-1-phosphate transferase
MDTVTSISLWPVLACLAASFGTCLLIILTQRWHGKLSLDHDLNGVQKIHKTPVPRIGGLGVVAGLLLAGVFSYQLGGETYETAGKLLLCAIPAFGAGLIEDFTKRVGVRTRLFASFISAALAYWVLDARLVDLDTPGLDYLIQFSAISFLFTCFAVGGMTNAINIIDGLNGLASGSVSLMLAGLATIAYLNGDTLVMKLCLWGIGATLGFMLLNYPFGRIFLGDGGAYLAGFWLAECGVLLLKRNPSVSTWAVLLVCIYPVWETVFSMYRRQVIEKVKSGMPDMTHLHHLLLKARVLKQESERSWAQHGMVSLQIWALVAICQAAAISLYISTTYLSWLTVLFAALYTFIYAKGSRANRYVCSETPGAISGGAN